MRKCAERVEAGLLIHLPSGAETQLWMHKRPWPEGKATVYRAFTNTDGWSYCSGQCQWLLLHLRNCSYKAFFFSYFTDIVNFYYSIKACYCKKMIRLAVKHTLVNCNLTSYLCCTCQRALLFIRGNILLGRQGNIM